MGSALVQRQASCCRKRARAKVAVKCVWWLVLLASRLCVIGVDVVCPVYWKVDVSEQMWWKVEVGSNSTLAPQVTEAEGCSHARRRGPGSTGSSRSLVP
eukprot:6460317-Amphidinium_carterae.1